MIHRDVPYDAEIEYLQSDGYAYIDTGIKVSSAIRYELLFHVTEVPSNNFAIFGGRIAQSNSASNLFYYAASYDVTFSWRYGSRETDGYTMRQTGDFYATSLSAPREMIIDGNKLSITDSTFSNNYNIYIFALNNSGNLAGNTNQSTRVLRIKTFRMHDGNTFVRDYIPVRVGNVGYIYDKVSGKLFGNAGTGNFILGPDVAPGRYANEIAFLESTGSQYIDTGIIPTDKHGFRVSCYVPQKAGGGSYDDRVIGIHGTSRWLLSIHDNSDATFFGWNDAYSSLGEYYNTNVVADLNYLNDRTAKINNETKISTLSTLGSISKSAFLFGNRNTDALFIGRIYSCKITYEDTLVRDFIPVEYNNIGYMYDKVSGEFFANQGTGKFVLGHRAPRFDGKACARSYSRRQLMAEHSGYKRLNFIANNGFTASTFPYLNLGFNIAPSTKIVIDFYTIANGISTQMFFGHWSSFALRTLNKGTYYTLNVGAGNAYGVGANVNPEGKRALWTLDKDNMSLVINNSTTYTKELNLGTRFLSTTNVYLFWASGYYNWYGTTWRVYSFQRYENDVLVMDLVPVQDRMTGINGMYDRISKAFFKSPRSNFVGG